MLSLAAQRPGKGDIHIRYSPGHPANRFIPSKLIGGALDGHEKGDIDRMLTPQNIRAMLSVGLKPVSYRIRTELEGAVWHWNPSGSWSEKDKAQGYWISDSTPVNPIMVSNGYSLPRRGNTNDQANEEGYSHITDGNASTFWKSNPYLDSHYTEESNDLHPQWVIIDLGELQDVNAIRIKWGNPYALSFTVDYALDIGSDYFEPFRPNLWHAFPHRFFDYAGDSIVQLAAKPLKVRFVRVSMTSSSYTTHSGSTDIRDKLGFAIREMEIGYLDVSEGFHDLVHHQADHRKQSAVYVSSTDPWHRAGDLNPKIEQPGLDRFFSSGLTNGLPPLMPVGLLYDTPENVVAMVKYCIARHYPVEELEMGEEPEGQLISPSDYAALYYQWAIEIKKAAHGMKMGGPGFATLAFELDDPYTFSEATWTREFLSYLKKRNGMQFFNFFSFEWYPFDDVCAPSAPQLMAAPGMLDIALQNIRRETLPANTPIYLTEYGYSAFGGKAEVEMEGALMYADILGKFLELGGGKNFLYGYEPAYLEQTENCDFGNNILFGLGHDGKIKFRTAAYFGMQMLTHFWTQPADTVELYPATADIVNKKKQPIVTAYALRSAGGHWSTLVINKDPERSWQVKIHIDNLRPEAKSNFQASRIIQYGKAQYRWLNNGAGGHPTLSLPPVIKKMSGAEITLPPYSITIVN